MKTVNLEQSASFKASPADVYDALMNSAKHAEFTGAPATISENAGGTFAVHGGYIGGENLELVKDKKIVQAWRAMTWPAKHYSVATYSLEADGKGTKLTFTQTGIPEEALESIATGWHSHYWEPMKKMLDK